MRYTPAREAKLRKRVHTGKRKLQGLKSKLAKVQSRLKANAQGICFESRKLFKIFPQVTTSRP